jgi:SAM-dependent methyltransferase/uncharacterized protein YbaR (Trm112 family)
VGSGPRPIGESDVGAPESAERERRRERVAALCACPSCQSGLGAAELGRLRCPTCAATYLVEDGVPILIPAGVDFLQSDSQWVPELALQSHPRLRSAIDRVRSRIAVEPVYKTKASRAVVRQFTESFATGCVILNVGSGRTRYGRDVVNIEIAPGPEVDIVGVAEFLPVRSGSADGVILMAVLEHVQNAAKTLSEVRRVLRPGGLVFVDVPFIQGYHAAPGDYRRYTEQGLRTELAQFGFEVEDSGVAVGPASAMAWIASEFLALLVSGRSALGYRIARNISGIVVSPIKYADRWLATHPYANRIPSAVWVRARLRD